MRQIEFGRKLMILILFTYETYLPINKII